MAIAKPFALHTNAKNVKLQRKKFYIFMVSIKYISVFKKSNFDVSPVCTFIELIFPNIKNIISSTLYKHHSMKTNHFNNENRH